MASAMMAEASKDVRFTFNVEGIKATAIDDPGANIVYLAAKHESLIEEHDKKISVKLGGGLQTDAVQLTRRVLITTYDESTETYSVKCCKAAVLLNEPSLVLLVLTAPRSSWMTATASIE